jgi:hypothetical protein
MDVETPARGKTHVRSLTERERRTFHKSKLQPFIATIKALKSNYKVDLYTS